VQCCQVVHAALDFAVAFPALTTDWHASSNTLVVLAVRDELALSWLGQDAQAAGLAIVMVHEPDLGGALTAMAVEPAGWRLFRGVPMAFASDPSLRLVLGGGDQT
jgi:uncharacterized protein (DUF697 family)